MHSDQGDNDHSDAEQHSGSEQGHQNEDEDEEDVGHRSDGGSPAGSGVSGAGSARSDRGSLRSDRRYMFQDLCGCNSCVIFKCFFHLSSPHKDFS